jgi:hypothetical protein
LLGLEHEADPSLGLTATVPPLRGRTDRDISSQGHPELGLGWSTSAVVAAAKKLEDLVFGVAHPFLQFTRGESILDSLRQLVLQLIMRLL